MCREDFYASEKRFPDADKQMMKRGQKEKQIIRHDIRGW